MRIVRDVVDGGVRVAFHGELDLATVDQVAAQISAELAVPGLRGLVLDLAGLTFCDSTGIDALINAQIAARDRGVAFQVVRPRGIVRRTLTATGVLELLTTATG